MKEYFSNTITPEKIARAKTDLISDSDGCEVDISDSDAIQYLVEMQSEQYNEFKSIMSQILLSRTLVLTEETGSKFYIINNVNEFFDLISSSQSFDYFNRRKAYCPDNLTLTFDDRVETYAVWIADSGALSKIVKCLKHNLPVNNKNCYRSLHRFYLHNFI